MTTRTLDKALKKFELVQGSVGDGEKTACEASLLNWISGADSWGDTLECAHPMIRGLIISHNDDGGTTTEQRVEAVRLGMDGAIDTWWVPTSVVLAGLAAPNRETVRDKHEQLTALLTFVAAWKLNKARPDLGYADLRSANLGYANLGYAHNLADAFLSNTQGNEYTKLPAGWKVNEAGLIVKSDG